MSWHCAYCGKTENVTGYVTIHNISGGIPFHMVTHLTCLRKTIPKDAGNLRDSLQLLNERSSKKGFCNACECQMHTGFCGSCNSCEGLE